MKAVWLKHYDCGQLDHPWVVTFSRRDTYLYGEQAREDAASSRRSTIARWCYDNGVNDFTVSESGSAVGFLTEGEAFLFYLAHA